MENNTRKRLPIGMENFKVVRESCYYVDRALLRKEFMETPFGTSYFFSRPRRFGKSLTLSLIQTFLKWEKPLLFLLRIRLSGKGKAVIFPRLLLIL